MFQWPADGVVRLPATNRVKRAWLLARPGEDLATRPVGAGTVADISEQLETDDAVAMIEDLDEEDQQAVLAKRE